MMNFMGNPYGKVCTFTRRLQGMQLFTYCLIATQLVLFLAGIQVNYISSTYRTVMMVLILLAFSIMVVTCFKVSSIDPVDTVLLQYRNGDPKKIESEITSCLYCDSCNSYVKNTSKHCKLCDRCVHKFDHHCTWVNNCIGAENYKWFIGMIISAFLFKLFFLVAVGLAYQEQNWYNFLAVMVIAWILFAVTLPLAFMLFALVCFHMMLISKGMTTFEFIMMQREQDQAKMTAQEDGQPKPQDINKTDENITGLAKEGQTNQQLQFKGTIFQESSEEYSQKMECKKIEQSTNNKVSKTHQTQTIEQKESNQQEMKDFFVRHKSLKFLVGQSLVIQEYRSNNYQSLRQRQAQTDMRKGRQKAYNSTKNRQGK